MSIKYVVKWKDMKGQKTFGTWEDAEAYAKERQAFYNEQDKQRGHKFFKYTAIIEKIETFEI